MSRPGPGRPLRRLAQGVVVGVVLAAVTVVATSLLGLEPDPVVVSLLVLLALACLALLLGSAGGPQPTWRAAAVSPSVTAGRDGATQAHLRVLENHRTSRQPGPEVRDRLAALADRTLVLRHHVRLDDPRARDLLGDDVLDALTGPVERLSPRRIDHLLTTIEEL
ncbi:hypothetical protein GCM10023340_44600 [Nocardioides marinquilinus]|uniref:Uncharacterized protein n=1 Tax=Nocardioides marinquilinus TaxID=1210400 RepID=A0ABP9Q9D8_9ACTN